VSAQGSLRCAGESPRPLRASVPYGGLNRAVAEPWRLAAGASAARRGRATSAARPGLHVEGDQAPGSERAPASRSPRRLLRRAPAVEPRGALDGDRARRWARGGVEPSQRRRPLGVRQGASRPRRHQRQARIAASPAGCPQPPTPFPARRGHSRPAGHPRHPARPHVPGPGDGRGAEDRRAGDRRGGQARRDRRRCAAPSPGRPYRRTGRATAAPHPRRAHLPPFRRRARTPLPAARGRCPAPGASRQTNRRRVRGRLLLARPRPRGRDRRLALPPHSLGSDPRRAPLPGPHRRRPHAAPLLPPPGQVRTRLRPRRPGKDRREPASPRPSAPDRPRRKTLPEGSVCIRGASQRA
jgi:hypothetical protein